MDSYNENTLFPIILHKNIKEQTNNKMGNKRQMILMALNLHMLKNCRFLNMTRLTC